MRRKLIEFAVGVPLHNFGILFGDSLGDSVTEICRTETDEVAYSVDYNRCLARARSGKDKERPFCVENRLFLSFI